MGVVATALRHLMAAGVTGDALVTAIEDIEAELNAAPGKPQRSSGAMRTERYRAKLAAEASQKASHVTVGDVCDAETVTSVTSVTDVTVCDARDVSRSPSLPLPPNEINSNPPAPTHPDNTTRARKSSAHPGKPDGVRQQVWDDFLSVRKAKRAPLTETALDGIRREAVKAGWPLDGALAECVARGWQGFKADWVSGAQPPAPVSEVQRDRPTPISRTAGEWRAMIGDEEFERRRDSLLIAEDERKVAAR